MDALGNKGEYLIFRKAKEEHIDNINAYCVGLSYHQCAKGLVP